MKKFKILLIVLTTSLCLNNFVFAMEKFPQDNKQNNKQNNNLNNQQIYYSDDYEQMAENKSVIYNRNNLNNLDSNNYDNLIISSDNFKNLVIMPNKPQSMRLEKIPNLSFKNIDLTNLHLNKNKKYENPQSSRLEKIPNLSFENIDLTNSHLNKNKKYENPQSSRLEKIPNLSFENIDLTNSHLKKNINKKIKNLKMLMHSETGIIDRINKLRQKIISKHEQKDSMPLAVMLVHELFDFVDNKFDIDSIFLEIKDYIKNKSEYAKQVADYDTINSKYLEILENSLNLCKRVVSGFYIRNDKCTINYKDMVYNMKKMLCYLKIYTNEEIVGYVTEIVKQIIFIAEKIYIPKIQEQIDKKDQNIATYKEQKNEILNYLNSFKDFLKRMIKNQPKNNIIDEDLQINPENVIDQTNISYSYDRLDAQFSNLKISLESEIPGAMKNTLIQEFIIELINCMMTLIKENNNKPLIYPNKLSNMISKFENLIHETLNKNYFIKNTEISSTDEYLKIIDYLNLNKERNKEFVERINNFFKEMENERIVQNIGIESKNYKQVMHSFLNQLDVFMKLEKENIAALDNLIEPVIKNINSSREIKDLEEKRKLCNQRNKHNMELMRRESDRNKAKEIYAQITKDNADLDLTKRKICALDEELKSFIINPIFKNINKKTLEKFCFNNQMKIKGLKRAFNQNKTIVKAAIKKHPILPQYSANRDWFIY